MTQQAETPVFSWDEAESDDQNDQEDFLSGVAADEVPKACSIDNPSCEACQ